MSAPDRHALHQLSIADWEQRRARRADDLARALAGLLDSARALPDGCPDLHRLLASTATAIRTELHATLNRPNPLRRTQHPLTPRA